MRDFALSFPVKYIDFNTDFFSSLIFKCNNGTSKECTEVCNWTH